jgi:microcystin-dependent protein
MSQPFVGEIRLFGGNFAPAGWAFCNGQLLSIAENDVLFTLIGTTYGGDGQSTFALPDLQGRIPVHQGSGFVIGQKAGTETITLTVNQMPTHTHVPSASSTGGSDTPSGNVWGKSPTGKPYGVQPSTVSLNTQSVSIIGNSQPHDNQHPYLTISYIISLFGIFPSQN